MNYCPKRSFLLLILPICLFFSASLNAQGVEDAMSTGELMNLGKSKYDSAQYELSGLLFKQAMNEFYAKKEWVLYINAVESYASSAYIVGSYTKALSILNKGIANGEKHLGEDDFHVGTLYNSLGAILYYTGECDKAFPFIKKGIRNMERVDPKHADLGVAYNNLATCADVVEGLEESLAYYQKALAIFLDKLGPESEKVATAYSNIGWTYSALGDYDQQRLYYKKSLAIRQGIYGSGHVKLVANYINMGAAYYRMGNYAKMYEYSAQALTNIQNSGIKKHPYLSTVYLNHASYYSAIKDYETASGYYLNAIRDDKKNLGEFHPNLAVSYFNLSDNLGYQDKIDEGLFYYEQGREVYLKSKNVSPSSMANGFRSVARLYTKKKEFRKAIRFYEESLHIYENKVTRNHPQVIQSLVSIASLYGELGEFDKQLKMYYRAIRLNLKKLGANSPTNGRIYRNLAHFYADRLDTDSAMHYIDKSIAVFGGSFDHSKKEQLPAWNQIFFPEELIDMLKLKGSIYLDKKEDRVSNLNASFNYFELAAQVMDSIRYNQVSFEGKQDLAAQAISVYEGGIKASLGLLEETGDNSFFEKAFYFTEKGKATLLYQSIQESEARVVAGIPESVYLFEKEIKLRLSLYRNKIDEEEVKGDKIDAKKLAFWRRRVFTLNQQKDSLISALEYNYPRYFELKYDAKVSDIQTIQDFLGKHSSQMAAYFEGDENLYLFYLLSTEKKAFTIPKDFPLENWVNRFCQSVYGPFIEGGTPEKLDFFAEEYRFLGHELLKKLMPFIDGTDELNKLIVIPDGQLGYIPFDGLLTESPKSKGKYRAYPYLIRDVDLSYAYSANLLVHNYLPRSMPLPEKRLVAFSPMFEESDNALASNLRANLNPLTYSKPEVNAVSKSLGGDVFIDENATEGAFKEIAPNYQIIHISSHAMVNDQKPLYSQIAFSLNQNPDSTEITINDGFLNLEELFHLNLPAEMVVLSACETGIGKLYRGEGISSLARGFSYAGARSIVTTLWKVNDEATATIMEAFYENLDAGLTKDVSLRKAKLSYLAKADNLGSHPFYWAGYIPIGNMSQLEKATDWVSQGLFILLVLLIGVLGVAYIRSRHRAN